MIHGIEHIGVSAMRPQQLKNWYVEVLNCSVVSALEEQSIYFLTVGEGGMMEIYPARKSIGEFENQDAGIRHIAIRVSGFEEECERLRQKGVEFIEALKVSTDSVKIAFFRDPEGNLLHLVDRKRKLA